MLNPYFPYSQLIKREQAYTSVTTLLINKAYVEIMIEELAALQGQFQDDEQELYISFETRDNI